MILVSNNQFAVLQILNNLGIFTFLNFIFQDNVAHIAVLETFDSERFRDVPQSRICVVLFLFHFTINYSILLRVYIVYSESDDVILHFNYRQTPTSMQIQTVQM